MRDDADILAATQRGSVVAAAGCGKTELIAKTVGRCAGRQLVLTHTNAGVEAIRRRLRHFGAPSSKVSVDTLDGWCLKYVASYPGLSGGVSLDQDGLTDWSALRVSMVKLLDRHVVRKIIECSYEGVLVDEYQDCGTGQHAVVCKLAEFRPVRVLGDPLQAVFGWAGPLPDWNAEVTRVFPGILALTTPWRWQRDGGNAALGAWLSRARTAIEQRQGVQIQDPDVTFVQLSDPWKWQDAARDACFAAAGKGGTVVAICKWPKGCHTLASMTGGLFQCVEPIEAKHGAQMLTRLESALATERAEVLLVFASDVAVHIGDHVAQLRSALAGGECHTPGLSVALSKLGEVGAGGGAEVCAHALEAVLALDGVRVFRRELVWAVLDTLRDVGLEQMTNLCAALRIRRNLTSHVGRRLARCTAGTTLLVKGMEFDHAVVVYAGGENGFSRNDLYVALTRGAKSLTILSAEASIGV